MRQTTTEPKYKVLDAVEVLVYNVPGLPCKTVSHISDVQWRKPINGDGYWAYKIGNSGVWLTENGIKAKTN